MISTPGLDQAACEQELLAPAVASVAVAGLFVLLAQVEGVARAWVRQQRQRLRLELIQRAQFAFLVEGALQRVETLPEQRCGR